MKGTIRYFALHLLSLLCLAAVTNASIANEINGSDRAASSLKKNHFPWYESSTGEFKSVGDIPDAQKPKPKSAPVDFQLIDVVMRVLFWTLIAVVVVWFIVLLIRAIQDFPDKKIKLATEMPIITQEHLELLPEITRGVTDFLSEAEKQAALGDFSRAMIFYYSWQLLMLGEQEVIELESGKTNRQYLRETSRNRPDLRNLFTHSVRMFEDAIYGGIVLVGADFQGLWNQRNILFLPSSSTRSRSSARRGS